MMGKNIYNYTLSLVGDILARYLRNLMDLGSKKELAPSSESSWGTLLNMREFRIFWDNWGGGTRSQHHQGG